MRRVTIKDIAHHLRLSPSTVSRALAGDKNIRKETRDLIYKAADELGYRRNRLAVSLRSGRSNIIGAIVDKMTDTPTLHLLAGVEKTLHDRGMHLMLANSDDTASREWANLRMMEDARVDGIIVVAYAYKENREEYAKLRRAGVPVVFVGVAPYDVEDDNMAAHTPADLTDIYGSGENGAIKLLDMIQIHASGRKA